MLRRFSSVAAAALVVSALLSAPLAADSPQPPPYYAIQNVRVVSGADAPLEGAIVVIGSGLIEAVGVGIDVPADAWVLDGEGLTLYPGLIDAMTTLGQKREEEPSGDPRRGGGFPGASSGPQIRGPQDRPQTTPWLSVANELAEDSRIEKWRQAGFTAVVSTPEKGIFAGQAAVINLSDAESRETVVAADVVQRLNFRSTGGFRSYPGTLMGVLSYIKQVFSDTGHYTLAKAAYGSDPSGRERPTYDRALAPIEAALADGTPFLMPAHLGREIDRALALANEYHVPTVLYGGQGAYSRLEQIAAAGTSVLVSVNWPEEEKNRDPDADTPFRTLYHRRLAPTTPAALNDAGVLFAFYSDGVTSASKMFEGVRSAVEAGLSEEAALAALTSNAAEIFGVGDRLGTIEVGKIANLVLANDWPWAEDVEIAAVFVDGRKYQERKSDEPVEEPAQDVSGTWAVTMTTPRGSQDLTAEIEMRDDGKVTGEITGRDTTAIEDGRMSGELLTFETTRTRGPRTMAAKWTLTVEGEKFSGTMSAGPMSMEISGERTAQPEDDSEGEAERDSADGDAETEVTLAELERVMTAYHGSARQLGTFAVTHTTVWTVSGETIENGTVVVADGKIAAVGGSETPIPEGVVVFDAAGGHLTPGIIDAHSHVAIEGGGNEALAVSAMVAIGDIINPDDIGIYRALAGGLTSINVLHGSANPIGGQNQVIKLRWGSDAETLKFGGAIPGIKFALGENPKRSNSRGFGRPQRYPQTRLGVMDVIRQAFTEAVEYQKEWHAYEAATAADSGGRRSGRTATPLPRILPPRRDYKLEVLKQILEGDRVVHSHSYRADEILQLLRLAEDFGFRIATLQHVLEGYKVADEIAAHGAGASTFSDWWGYKVEANDAIPYNAALMTERGVVVSINSDSGEEMRHLNQEAGKAVKWGGMDEVEALKLVTLNPAIQLRIDDRVGSIEVGKDADLTLFDGHPLSIFSVVQKTFVDGDLYFDIETDRERQAMVDDIKKRMQGKDEDEDSDDSEEEDDSQDETPSPEVLWGDEVTYSCHEVER